MSTTGPEHTTVGDEAIDRLARRIAVVLIRLRDRGSRASVVLGVVAVVGFCCLVVGGEKADSPLPAVQLDWLVSAGLAGVCLIGAAVGLLTVHLERRANATEREDLQSLIRELAGQVRERPH